MRVVFLDYDDVVNTYQWSLKAGKWICRYGLPEDDAVNNVQAVQWVSEFCEKYGYVIVVSSSWRVEDNYEQCLRNGGLRDTIEIIGKTKYLPGRSRGDEISQWLSEHPEVEQYLIFDDQTDMGEHKDHLVRCGSSAGFREEEFHEAERLHNRWTTHASFC